MVLWRRKGPLNVTPRVEAISGAAVVIIVRVGGLPQFFLEGDDVVVWWAGAFPAFEDIGGPITLAGLPS